MREEMKSALKLTVIVDEHIEKLREKVASYKDPMMDAGFYPVMVQNVITKLFENSDYPMITTATVVAVMNGETAKVADAITKERTGMAKEEWDNG